MKGQRQLWEHRENRIGEHGVGQTLGARRSSGAGKQKRQGGKGADGTYIGGIMHHTHVIIIHAVILSVAEGAGGYREQGA